MIGKYPKNKKDLSIHHLLLHQTSELPGKTAAKPAEVPPDNGAPDRKLDEQGRPGMPGIPEPAEHPCPPAQARKSRGLSLYVIMIWNESESGNKCVSRRWWR